MTTSLPEENSSAVTLGLVIRIVIAAKRLRSYVEYRVEFAMKARSILGCEPLKCTVLTMLCVHGSTLGCSKKPTHGALWSSTCTRELSQRVRARAGACACASLARCLCVCASA